MFKLLLISITVTLFCLEAEATDYTITILPDEVTQDNLHVLGGILNTAESSEKVNKLLRRVALAAVEETNKNLSARIDDLGFLKLDDNTSCSVVRWRLNHCQGRYE